MTISNSIRDKWLRQYEELEERGRAFKDSQSVSFGLLEYYDSLTLDEQKIIHQILAEWFLSERDEHRYDARFITSQRNIIEMISTLNDAILHINNISGPVARNEAEQLNELRIRLIEKERQGLL